MKSLLVLAARSAFNRRFVLLMIVLSIALSTLLLLGIERIRQDVRSNFAQSVSSTDLIVGARTGSVQLLLYSVFRIGSATNNIRWQSAQAIAKHRAVAWMVPISLGDSHKGFPVIGTTDAYFEHYQYGDHEPLRLSQGRPFKAVFEVVLGAEVAQRLGYGLASKLILSHGDGALAANDHADKPFTVVGALAPTGTAVDRSLHISLAAMEAMHLDWVMGVPMPGMQVSAQQATQADLTPKSVSAVLLGLRSRAAVFAVQRSIAEFAPEPLMAVLPGVALDELWDVVGVGERGLLMMSMLVGLVSLLGLVAVMMAGLNERRRELAILRAVGAGPKQVMFLLASEGALLTLAGVVLGSLACAALIAGLGDWVQLHYGVRLSLRGLSSTEWSLLGLVLGSGWLASLLPGWRAYRLSLLDGLSPRV